MSPTASKVLYRLSVCIIAIGAVGMSGCGGRGRTTPHSTATPVNCTALAKDLAQLEADFTQLTNSPGCAKANAGVKSAQQMISTYLSSGSFQCQVTHNGKRTWVDQSSLLALLQAYFNALSTFVKNYSCHQTPDCFDLVDTVGGLVAAQTKFEDDVFTPFIDKAKILAGAEKDQVCGNLALWHKQIGDSKAPYLTQPGSTLQCKVQQDGSVYPVANLILGIDQLSSRFEKTSEELKCDPSIGGGSSTSTGVDPVAARRDICKLLGLPEDASYPEIKKAYNKRVLLLHPDKNVDKPAEEQEAAKKAFVELSEKWDAFNDTAPKTSAQVD